MAVEFRKSEKEMPKNFDEFFHQKSSEDESDILAENN